MDTLPPTLREIALLRATGIPIEAALTVTREWLEMVMATDAFGVVEAKVGEVGK